MKSRAAVGVEWYTRRKNKSCGLIVLIIFIFWAEYAMDCDTRRVNA